MTLLDILKVALKFTLIMSAVAAAGEVLIVVSAHSDMVMR